MRDFYLRRRRDFGRRRCRERLRDCGGDRLGLNRHKTDIILTGAPTHVGGQVPDDPARHFGERGFECRPKTPNKPLVTEFDPGGALQQTISIPVAGDAWVEEHEEFQVLLSSATVAICWLIKSRQITAEQAQACLTEKRPHVNQFLVERPVVQRFEKMFLQADDNERS